MPCFIKLSNHVIEAVPKVQLLNHSVILNNVKNLNTFIVKYGSRKQKMA